MLARANSSAVGEQDYLLKQFIQYLFISPPLILNSNAAETFSADKILGQRLEICSLSQTLGACMVWCAFSFFIWLGGGGASLTGSLRGWGDLAGFDPPV